MPLEVQQRGSTSLHFGDTYSAIDIPEVESREADAADHVRAHALFGTLSKVADQHLRAGLILQITTDLGVPETLVSDVASRTRGETPDARAVNTSLLEAEFEAFDRASRDAAPTEDFVTRIAQIGANNGARTFGLESLIEHVVLVDRLREVRAVREFRRHTPDATPVPAVAPSTTQTSWLPAVEGYGEGIFVRFGGSALDAWAAHGAVATRIATLQTNQAKSDLGLRLPPSSAQYVMLHTFAHVLMRELAFKSGYSAPSLRERIYCENEGDYAVFIYTTSSDIEGTLGGLVRQGEFPNLAQSTLRALEQASWCPNDPVCSESHPQSIDGLNLAACHSCLLAPETSCESFNLLLDRTLLLGNQTVPGYFDASLDQLLAHR